MRILISGAHGLIGAALSQSLRRDGHDLIHLVRARTAVSPEEAAWDPQHGLRDPESMPTPDAVFHLAGENIASGRWTAARKAAIRASRVQGTQRLGESLLVSGRLPRVFLCASAIGYYGDGGAVQLDESAGPGQGFLAEVCHAWEAASRPLASHGVRVVHLRFGVVLSESGGALAKMLPPFRLGLGGPVGGGRQYISWITLDDAVGAAKLALSDDRAQGPLRPKQTS